MQILWLVCDYLHMSGTQHDSIAAWRTSAYLNICTLAPHGTPQHVMAKHSVAYHSWRGMAQHSTA